MTPTNPAHQQYRRAFLWFDSPDGLDGLIKVKRTDGDWHLVRRGTLQHEVLEGEQATAFIDGSRLRLRVNSRGDAGGYEGLVPYALIISLEVAVEVQLPLYTEVSSRLQVPIRA